MGTAFAIEDYCLDNLDKAKINSTGQIIATCPFCGKYGSFYVAAETGHYICHKCEERGRHLVGLVAHIEGITWREAKGMMLKRAVQFRRKDTMFTLLERIKALRSSDDDGYDGDDDVEVELPREFVPVYKGGKWLFPTYLKKRGFKRKTAKAWGMGFCSSGYFYGRIVIPVDCPNGFSFTARDTTGAQEPRYLNPKGADHGRLLLGWNMVKIGADVTLVEGPLDAIKLWQHGIPALALMGKRLHQEQLGMLYLRWPADTSFTIMLDPEEEVAPYEVANQLICRFENVYIAHLPKGVDPGASTKAQADVACRDAKKFDGARNDFLSAKIKMAKKAMANRL